MSKYLKNIKNQKGVTLVELLAVLVIIGLIAAIAIPMIANTIEKSRNEAIVNEALNIISAAKLAHANGEGTESKGTYEFEMSILQKYVKPNYTDDASNITVTYNVTEGEWKIKGHAANEIEKIGTDASEQDLIGYLRNN